MDGPLLMCHTFWSQQLSYRIKTLGLLFKSEALFIGSYEVFRNFPSPKEIRKNEKRAHANDPHLGEQGKTWNM